MGHYAEGFDEPFHYDYGCDGFRDVHYFRQGRGQPPAKLDCTALINLVFYTIFEIYIYIYIPIY